MKRVSAWLRSEAGFFTILLLAAFLVRLYRINNPIADWHAFRQADTASVTREYVKHGIDWLRPHYHDLSNIQSGQPNPDGYRMVEFPLINGLLALLLRTFPALPLVLTSRLAAVFISLGTLLFLAGFAKTVSGSSIIGKLSGVFFAFLPFSIYYSRSVLPEPYLLFFSMGSLYFFTEALKTAHPFSRWQWWLSAVFLAAALLLKPFAVFLAPVYAVLVWQKPSAIRFSPWWAVYGAIAFTPLWLWREWIQQFPSGIPASDWLLNGNGIRLRPAWFRWLFYERFTKLILGYTGVFLSAGVFWRRRKELRVFSAWWLGLLLYAAVVATGNVQHDYYQVIFTPLLCFTLALGTQTWWQKYKKRLNRGVILLLILAMAALSWHSISGYFNVNHWEYVAAGQAVDRMTPPGARVIAPAFGDTQFLFQTNRTGWPIGFEISEKISQGAEYYVTASYDDEARELEKQYRTIEKTDRYLLLDLTQPKEGDTL